MKAICELKQSVMRKYETVDKADTEWLRCYS